MSASGDVNITVSDGQGGVASAPLQKVQAVIGCSSIGVNYQIVATRNPATLVSTAGYGTGVEAAALTCQAGGIVLFLKTPLTTKGGASTVAHTGTGSSVMAGTPDRTLGPVHDHKFKDLPLPSRTVRTR